MKKVLLGLGIVAALTPAIASAEGGYLGASYGRTELNVSDSLKDELASVGVSVEDTDQGWKIFGGYRFNDNVAVEVFHADLGDAEISNGTDWAKIGVDGYGLSAVGLLPVNENFDLFAKAGLFHWSADLTTSADLSAGDDGTDATYGIGAAYNMGTVSLRAELERYEVSGEDIDLISAGVSLNF